MRLVLERVALLASSLAITALFAEVSIRLLYPPAEFGSDRRLARRFHPNRVLRFESPYGEFATELRYNSVGMRDREHARAKPPGMHRILVVGDSFAEAKQVTREAGFPARLEDLLSREGSKVEVINAGHAGFGAADEHLVLRNFGVGRDPDVVIQAFFLNDVRDDYWRVETLEWDEAGLPVRMLGFQSELVLFLRDRAVTLPFVRKDSPVAVDEVGVIGPDPFFLIRREGRGENEAHWQRTLKVIEGSARLSRKIGAEFLLVIIPIGEQVDPTFRSRVADAWALDPDTLTRDPQERLLRFGEETGIAVLDLMPVLEQHKDQQLYFPYDGHWTPAAHDIAAREIARFLRTRGWDG